MHKPGLLADMFGEVREESDDVVLDLTLNLVDPLNVELHVLGFPAGLGRALWDHAQFRLRVASMRLNLEPDAEFRLWRPDGDHVGAGIAGDHWRVLRALSTSAA